MKIRSNTKLIHGVTRVSSWSGLTGVVVDSTRYTVQIAWDGSKLGPRWHDKAGMEIVS